jgi:multicomponent Na+:H+ antiporter subunit F
MLEIAIIISTGLLMLAFLISLIRLLLGPDLQDRVVSLDLIASAAGGLILMYMIITGEHRYIDIVIVLSLILFMGTVAIARFLNKEKK